jgi:3-oxoacyl-[acyl-carrier-protein] synthase-3
MDGKLADYIYIPGGGTLQPTSVKTLDGGQHFIHMRGNETFKVAVRALTKVSREVLEENNAGPEDVTHFIPHQANIRIINLVGQKLGVPKEKVYANIDRVGNTSAASIPIALDEVNCARKLQKGDLVLMSAFGAGLTWAGTLLRWSQ